MVIDKMETYRHILTALEALENSKAAIQEAANEGTTSFVVVESVLLNIEGGWCGYVYNWFRTHGLESGDERLTVYMGFIHASLGWDRSFPVIATDLYVDDDCTATDVENMRQFMDSSAGAMWGNRPYGTNRWNQLHEMVKFIRDYIAKNE